MFYNAQHHVVTKKNQFLKLENKGKSNLSLLSIIGTNDRRCAWRTSGSRRSRISRALAGTFSSSSTVSIKSKEVLQSRIQLTRWRPEVPDWWSKGWKDFRIGKWWEWGAFSCGLNAYKKLGKMRLHLWLWAHWGKNSYLSKNSHCENIIFWQNSPFRCLIFYKIHLFKI